MKIFYTDQAIESLKEALDFIAPKVSYKKLVEIRTQILDKADTLLLQPRWRGFVIRAVDTNKA